MMSMPACFNKLNLSSFCCLIAVIFLFPSHISALKNESPPNDATYEVIVSLSRQHIEVYREGQLIRSMVCSTGVPGTDDATPTGNFVINQSGSKRGTWFYSNSEKEGAKYWVGFIGGTYLFHSVPMDKTGNIIRSEAAKLGTPASHGCVRLSVADAYWFYSNIPSGTSLHILADDQAVRPEVGTKPISREDIPTWLDARGPEYKQAYVLSCEIALTRVSLGLMGITGVTEDQILSSIPRGIDPETSFVCDNLNGGRLNVDGSIHWNNYGTHPPVVVGELNRRLKEKGLLARYIIQEGKADDAKLRLLVTHDKRFLGAIVWLVGHPERWGKQPSVNERGMVLGEHVRFLEPVLAPDGRFQMWDPETGKTFRADSAGDGRNLFSNRVVGIFAK